MDLSQWYSIIDYIFSFQDFKERVAPNLSYFLIAEIIREN